MQFSYLYSSSVLFSVYSFHLILFGTGIWYCCFVNYLSCILHHLFYINSQYFSMFPLSLLIYVIYSFSVTKQWSRTHAARCFTLTSCIFIFNYCFRIICYRSQAPIMLILGVLMCIFVWAKKVFIIQSLYCLHIRINLWPLFLTVSTLYGPAAGLPYCLPAIPYRFSAIIILCFNYFF